MASDNPKKFLWLDIETTGLDPQTCQIVEIAAVLTNDMLDIHKAVSYVTKPTSDTCWSVWAVEQHRASGLLEESTKRGMALSDAKSSLMSLLRMWAKPREVALAGRTIHFDRAFLRHHIPELEMFLHHRHLDVASIEMFIEHLGIKVERPPNDVHRAVNDLNFAMAQYRQFTELCAERHHG